MQQFLPKIPLNERIFESLYQFEMLLTTKNHFPDYFTNHSSRNEACKYNMYKIMKNGLQVKHNGEIKLN